MLKAGYMKVMGKGVLSTILDYTSSFFLSVCIAKHSFTNRWKNVKHVTLLRMFFKVVGRNMHVEANMFVCV